MPLTTSQAPTKPKKLYFNLYWHMHQPDYRDIVSNQYVLPWTYLHAIKDYTDMAHHLEANPKAKVNFNFVPVLLDQLEDYTLQFETKQMRDPLLALLAREHLEGISAAECRLIVGSCFKSHHEKMLSPFPHYQKLLRIFETAESATGNTELHYFSAQYKVDLLVWYHLAWTGESVRRNYPLVKELMDKGAKFSFEDRKRLFNLIGELIANLIPRYKALQDNKQIEISTTPHYHPILPLLLDFKSTKDAMPDAQLPANAQYPGGRSRAVAQVQSAQRTHQGRFDMAAKGMWPAEGGVSHAALSLLAEYGVTWAATGQSVLVNSLNKSGLPVTDKQDYLYTPYKVTDGHHDILCFFRDDHLSDKIGFEYAKMYTSDAVNDFVRTLEHIQQSNTSDNHRVVSVILDGENAWEYYPYNGFYFLNELYTALANHPNIQMTTFSEIVALTQKTTESTATSVIPTPILPQIAAGSWVYGTFSTWIGSTDKNRGWDLLCEAKKAYDKVMQSDKLDERQRTACEQQLSICEGSDWFWWFGDYNSSVSVNSFDQLYRLNLMNLYSLLKMPVPEILHQPISTGGGNPDVGGTMRRGTE